MPAYGKVKVDTITYDLSGTATDISVSTIATDTDLALKADLSGATFTGQINGTSLVLNNDLTVNGTLTYLNSTDLEITDKNIIIGKVSTPSDATADLGGITLKGATDKEIKWVNATDAWTFSENIELASGKTFIGDGSTITALNASNISSGTVADARISALTASKLTGALPAISGANLTNLPPGGNTFTAVANGSIANNKAVKIDTDGKVSQIAQTTAVDTSPNITSTTNGIYITGYNESPYQVKCTYVGNDKLLVTWSKDNWPSSNKVGLKGVIGSYDTSGYFNNYGSEFEIDDNVGFTHSYDVAWDETNDTIIVAYEDHDDTRKGRAKFLKRSGNTLSFISSGTNPVLWRSSTNTAAIKIAWDNNIQRLILTYKSSSGQGHSMIANKNSSDDSYTFTQAGEITDGQVVDDVYTAMTPLTSGKVIFFWSQNSNARLYYNIGVVNTSNNLIAWGTPVSEANQSARLDVAYNSAKGIVGLVGTYNSNKPWAFLGAFNDSNNTMSGMTGDQMTSYTSEMMAVTYCPDSETLNYYYGYGSSPNQLRHRMFIHPTAGNQSSYTRTQDLDLSGSVDVEKLENITAIPGKGLIVGAGNWTQLSNRTSSAFVNTTIQQSSLTAASQFVGFADQAYTNGQTATIKTYGNSVDTLSGLTAGTEYYLQQDGTVGTSTGFSTFAAYTPLAGTALSATKLLIRDPYARA